LNVDSADRRERKPQQERVGQDRVMTANPRDRATRSQRKEQTMGRIISHGELDAKLDRYAHDPGRFEQKAKRLIRELDSAGVALEIKDPASWRKSASIGDRGRVPLKQQFRVDVESIELLDRENEARLARRVELARLRLEKALADLGVSKDELVEGVSHVATAVVGPLTADCSLPSRICRRWLELHALRVEMVERNLYLVLINVERYSHTTASQHDLIQEGSAALFRAVDGFDWRRGLLFRTYAVHWLNQAFRSHLYNFGNTVRVPVYLQKALKHINDARSRLGEAKAGVPEIAEAAKLSENLVGAAISAARTSRSIDVAFDDEDEGGRLRDLLQVSDEGPYTTALEDVSLEESLTQAMERLGDRERFVLQQRFGIGADREHTLAEVAGSLGVSLERVRQIQVRALNKLRTPALRRVIEPFLN